MCMCVCVCVYESVCVNDIAKFEYNISTNVKVTILSHFIITFKPPSWFLVFEVLFLLVSTRISNAGMLFYFI